MSITITIQEEFDDEIKLEEGLKYIANLIREGYASGIDPTWEIDGKSEDPEVE